VCTHKHGLTPFAHRLRTEGHDVEIVVWQPRYNSAWDGQFKEIDRDSKSRPSKGGLTALQEELNKDDEMILLTDIWELGLEATQKFTVGVQEDLTSLLRIGVWLHEDGTMDAPHLLIYDYGIWPGGMGRHLPAGVTMVRLVGDAAEMVFDLLLKESIVGRGLVEADLTQDEFGELSITAYNVGWQWLQVHAFVSELDNFGALLRGFEPRFIDGSKFVTALPVTIPPWPELGRAADAVEIKTTADTRSRTFWHDVALDTETQTLRSAGLDGLLGVSRGAGNSPSLALRQALAVADSIGCPQKQWRPDIGQGVTPMLDAIVEHFGVDPWA
jgi:hypothetical protein